MDHPGFYQRTGPHSLEKIVSETGATLGDPTQGSIEISDIRPLSDATPADAAFLDNPKYLSQLDATKAGACFIQPRYAERVPPGTVAMITPVPYRAYAQALALFYPEAGTPHAAWNSGSEGTHIHPSARLEKDVVVEPGAVIGEEA